MSLFFSRTLFFSFSHLFSLFSVDFVYLTNFRLLLYPDMTRTWLALKNQINLRVLFVLSQVTISLMTFDIINVRNHSPTRSLLHFLHVWLTEHRYFSFFSTFFFGNDEKINNYSNVHSGCFAIVHRFGGLLVSIFTIYRFSIIGHTCTRDVYFRPLWNFGTNNIAFAFFTPARARRYVL